MRIFPKTAGRTLVLLCLVCVTNIAAFPKDQAKLLKYFAAQSIPVDEIKVKENAVVARINYGVDDEIDEAKTEKDILAVAKKLAEAFSRSETIRLQYFIGGEELYELELANEDVKKAVEGQKSDEEILGAMAIIMPEGVPMPDISGASSSAPPPKRMITSPCGFPGIIRPDSNP